MRFQFVDAEKASFPVTVLCDVMQVSTAGFYAWRKRPRSRRQIDNDALIVKIRAIHKASRHTYGSPRVHAELVSQGISVGENRVARLMRENGIRVRPRRGYRCTTQRDPAHPVAENLLNRDFTAHAPNEKWVTDVTYVRTNEGWLYLAAMLDLYNREIVGWAMGNDNDHHLTLRALEMAVANHGAPHGLVHHSDRGSTYTAFGYRKRLKAYGIQCSMSRKADCWDNAVAESFFATLKKELVHRTRFTTRRQAAAEIFEYIEVFYNRIRKHSMLGYTSPVAYRRKNVVTALPA